MSDEDVLLVGIHGSVLVLTINRPEARNAITEEVAEKIAQSLDQLDENHDLRVGIITGAGGTFSAGMDLKALDRGERPEAEARGFAGLVERPPLKPLIAAVEGYALGGGFEIALACDLIVASEDATFGIPEVKHGLIAAAGGLFRLPRRIPYHLAVELALTGRLWSSVEAAEAKLVNRLVPPGSALDEAIRLASDVAANAPLAVAASKQVLVKSFTWSPRDAFFRQQEYVERILQSADAQEGVRAFIEKRQPVWRGR